MKKKKFEINIFVAVTFLVTAAICLTVFCAGIYINKLEEKRSFEEIKKITETLAREMKTRADSNQEELAMIADIIASAGSADTENTIRILKNFATKGDITHLEVLLPDNRVITNSGIYVDATDKISYVDELKRGKYISPKPLEDISHGDRKVIKNAIPIRRNGVVMGVLYGIIETEGLPAHYKTDYYAKDAQLYLVDGDSGELIIDTMHPTLGNIKDMQDHKVKKRYKSESVIDAISNGHSGYMIAYSETIGDNVYLYYTPVGVNNWVTMIAIPEKSIMSYANKTELAIYIMIAIASLILVTYFIVMTKLRKDEAERLRYMFKIEETLFDAHNHTENVKNALGIAAKKMKAEMAFFIKVDNDKVSNVYYHSPFDIVNVRTVIGKPLKDAIPNGDGENTVIKYGDGIYSLNGRGLDCDYYVDNYILTYSRDNGGKIVGVLGTINMEKQWKRADYIENVSHVFSLAADNITSYQSLKEIGVIDSLTGLLNKSCFEKTVESYEQNPADELVCVYVDIDGLNEINSRRGRSFGDEVLRTVAYSLKDAFGANKTYRIGNDEFVAFYKDYDLASYLIKQVDTQLKEKGYDISYGIAYSKEICDVNNLLHDAEMEMLNYKYERYHT